MIEAFMGQYRFLSNFYPACVVLDEVVYRTVEHAFQAAKTLDAAERQHIAACTQPGQAKRLGQRVTLRPKWNSMRILIMEQLVEQKFSYEPLRTQLLATGNEQLVEGNNWGDTFWGMCNGHGRNELGKVLMRVRDRLREAT